MNRQQGRQSSGVAHTEQQAASPPARPPAPHTLHTNTQHAHLAVVPDQPHVRLELRLRGVLSLLRALEQLAQVHGPPHDALVVGLV